MSLLSRNAYFTEISSILSRHRLTAFARLYTTSRHGGDVVAGYGTSYAIWQGRLIVFKRSIIERDYDITERLDITIFSRNVHLFNKLIAEAKKPPLEPVIEVWGGSGNFDERVIKAKRPLSSVFCAGSIIEDIKARIDWFLANEDWYMKRGIPYKLVFLFHGRPGTGKSSLIFALASEYDRNLAVINNLSMAPRLLASLPNRPFVVIEDIDMILNANREEDEDKDKDIPAPVQKKKRDTNPLHSLINALDGLATPHGLIMFITTNYKERLDPALIRKGRVDVDLEIGPLDGKATGDMFKAFYGAELEDYLGEFEFQSRTGAEVQAIFMSETSPRKASNKLKLAEHPPLHVVKSIK